MPWKTTSVMEERIKFVVRALRPGVNFSGLCREFGVSRRTGYRWLDRFMEAGNILGIRELSRRPHHSPSKTEPKYERRVVELRGDSNWGAKKLQVLLAREGVKLPVITINRIIKRNGLIRPEICHRPALKRFERPLPNDLWQMDFKGDYAVKGGRCYPLAILDDHSRYAVGLYALPGAGSVGVHRSLIRTFERYGLPRAMLMDHDTAWWSPTNGHGLTWLTVDLIKQGIKIYWSGYRHPQTQGKVERFHRTLKDAVKHKGRPRTMAGWYETLAHFLKEYNYIRPHEALGMAVPADRYQPSQRMYKPNPPPWEYPQGSVVKRLNSQGCLDYKRRRYFVCEALRGEQVKIEYLEKSIIISYRHMYIREIELETGRTIPFVKPA
ncbi:MAG: IS481 family transposase [Candidatus Zixiibacteriota bacterium]|nr:MAG: IS481 family transposase [candidate division Zixibacteria bacterium]